MRARVRMRGRCGAAYLLNGGCSDDGFEYFRGWLISRGRAVFEKALADPDSLAKFVGAAPELELEAIAYAAINAYKTKTGKDWEDLPRSALDQATKGIPTFEWPDEPTGEPWDEDDLDERFPAIADRQAGL